MELQSRLKAWFEEDEDRLSEDRKNEALLAAFPQEAPEALLRIKEEIFLALVMENLSSMPQLGFHAQKDLYPFPNSEELQKARAILHPDQEFEEKKKH